MEETKISFFSSIRTKMVLAMMVLAVLSGLVTCIILVPNIEDNIDSTNQSYMKDLAKAYGKMFDAEIQLDGIETALSVENLTLYLSDVCIDGISSSYVYVVSADGTMLYHPTPDKIGQPVENEAVKKTVEKISKGQPVENEVIEYVFKGVNKYAGVFVNDAQDFIVVVTADSDEIFETLNHVRNMALAALVAVIILVALIGSYIAYRIIKPVNQIAQLTVKVSNMDFTEDAMHGSLSARKDEIGRMSRALARLIGALAQVVDDIRTKSNNLMSAADALNTDASETATTMAQVESAVNDIAQGASSQADETQKATENIIVMGNMIEDTNEEVNKLLVFAQDMHESTEQAKSILKDLEDVNRRAEEYIGIISEQTNTTNESALKISEATKLITSIAEETNLLSLNASIEAARAGEQGRGFGVVAAEIQKLAEQSNESAMRIEEIIQELLLDSEKAVETMYDVKEVMRLQSDHVEQTETAFEQISEGVAQSMDGINKISERTSQLDEARTNVVDIVQDLTAIAEQNAAGTQETSASTTEVSAIVDDISDKSNILRQVAKDLDEEMSIFSI